MATYKIFRKQLIGIKLEATQGTVATLAATDYFYAQDISYDPQVEQLDRDPSRTSLGPVPAMIGKRSQQISFKKELVGSGVAGTTDVSLSAIFCSMGLTGATVASAQIFTPTNAAESTNFYGPGRSATIRYWKDGILQTIVGALCTSCKLTINAAKIPMLEVTYKGVWIDQTDTAEPTVSVNKLLPPIVQNAALTVEGYAGITSKFDIDFGIETSEIEDISSSGGVLGYMFLGHKAKASYEPLTPTLAAHNAFNVLINGTTGTLAASIGTAAGNKFVITCPCVQYTEVKYTDASGKLAYAIPLRLNDQNGNDWISISAA